MKLDFVIKSLRNIHSLMKKSEYTYITCRLHQLFWKFNSSLNETCYLDYYWLRTYVRAPQQLQLMIRGRYMATRILKVRL